MQRQLSLDAYADALGIAGDELRMLITAQTGRIAPETLARVAAAYEMEPRQVLAALSPVDAPETFSAWLGRHMEGITQTSLRARTQIAAPQLRAFVSGKELPDSDQAERLARALYVDRGEMARVIVADMTARVVRSAPPPEPAAADAAGATPASAPEAGVPDASPGRTRRRRSAPDAAETPSGPSEAAPAPEEAAPAAPSSEASAGRRRAPRRTPEPQPAAVEEPQAATPAPPRRSRRQAPPAEEAPAAAPAVAKESAAGDDSASPAPARRRRRGAPADAPPPAEGAPRPARGERAPLPRAAPGRQDEGASDGRPEQPIGESRPTERAPGPATGRQADAPPVAADVVPGEATLQLTPDEARLIRLWRRLHPHGRRATLQYIGSLLVEE